MQRIILWVFLILLSIILQSTVIPFFSLAGIYPDLVIATIMVLALWYGRLAGIWAGFLTGLLLDVWAPTGELGVHALALVFVSTFISFFESGRINSGPILQFFLFVLGSTIHDIVIFVVNTGSVETVVPFLLTEAVPRALFTAIFGMALIFMGAQFHPYGRR